MLALRQSLQNCGYCGACEDEYILTWAIRTGACSEFFNDLLTWLQDQLSTARLTILVRSNIRNLFSKMRSSVLMTPHVTAAETVLNPKEYRLQTLKVLLNQLVLARRTEEHAYDVQKNTTSDQLDQFDEYGELKVTLNAPTQSCGRGWNERLVRYNPNLLKMYDK